MIGIISTIIRKQPAMVAGQERVEAAARPAPAYSRGR